MTKDFSRRVLAVRDDFNRRGISFAEWAKPQGFNLRLVYDVLAGRRRALRGQTHNIAVALGLKDGVQRSLRRKPTSA